jgi:hypothetical protein
MHSQLRSFRTETVSPRISRPEWAERCPNHHRELASTPRASASILTAACLVRLHTGPRRRPLRRDSLLHRLPLPPAPPP